MAKLRSKYFEKVIPRFGGQNTAKSFSEIEIFESPQMLNFIPRRIGGIANRDGTLPLTTAALGSPIKALFNLRKAGVNSILAAAGTTLYKYGSGTFTGQTMTNPLVTSAIDAAQYKDASSNEVLVIADGGSLKYYNGTAVANITPAANDASPAAANTLATLNSSSPAIGITVHHNRLVIWGANSDQINHSKPGYYDYFRTTDYQRWVNQNDYVVNCLSYSGTLIVLMRRHIGVLFGDGYSSTPTSGDWSQDFLDTTDGCVNANTVQLVVFPDGREEVFYWSDKGVHAVYTINTVSLDTSARFSTRSVTRDQIKWDDLKLSTADIATASSWFRDGYYWTVYKQGGVWKGFVFNTVDSQWYPIGGVSANAWYHDETYFYFAGDEGHLKVFDSTVYTDWSTAAKTAGTNTDFAKTWYMKLVTALDQPTGFDHLWDTLEVEAKQHNATSTIDVEVNTVSGNYTLAGAIKTEIMVVGVSKIGEAQIANTKLTDIVNNAKPIGPLGLKGQYAQVKLSNSRNEPVEIYSLKLKGRAIWRA